VDRISPRRIFWKVLRNYLFFFLFPCKLIHDIKTAVPLSSLSRIGIRTNPQEHPQGRYAECSSPYCIPTLRLKLNPPINVPSPRQALPPSSCDALCQGRSTSYNRTCCTPLPGTTGVSPRTITFLPSEFPGSCYLFNNYSVTLAFDAGLTGDPKADSPIDVRHIPSLM